MTSIEKDITEPIDSTASLASSNKLEVLLFAVGGNEIFGINVLKVKEVCTTPLITRLPNMSLGVEGVINLRGNIVPILNLATFLEVEPLTGYGETMIVTEYCRQRQGFLVQSVDHIIRVNWTAVKTPEDLVTNENHFVTSVIEQSNGKLVSILDIEQILVQAFGELIVPDIDPANVDDDVVIFFVDDSIVARRKIAEVIQQLSVKHYQATNGLEAWKNLQNLADQAKRNGEKLSDRLRLILVDAEMPEMDGYSLTKNIKSDPRFTDIPVVMHSSLSSEANRIMGKKVGVDAYVSKFDPVGLADTLRPLIEVRR